MNECQAKVETFNRPYVSFVIALSSDPSASLVSKLASDLSSSLSSDLSSSLTSELVSKLASELLSELYPPSLSDEDSSLPLVLTGSLGS